MDSAQLRLLGTQAARQGDAAQRLEAAVASGEARPDLDPQAVIEAIAGSVLFALLLDITADLGPAWVDRTTSLLLKGIAR